MDLATLRHYLYTRPRVTESTLAGCHMLAYKVHGQPFALLTRCADPSLLTLKCDPRHAEVLRTLHPAIRASDYMNRRHWNTITLDGSLDEAALFRMVDDAYALVLTGAVAVYRDSVQAAD